MIYSEIKAPEINEQVSEPIVMKSAAGYYVGRAYYDEEVGGTWLPYSRESDYFKERKSTEKFLNYLVENDMI